MFELKENIPFVFVKMEDEDLLTKLYRLCLSLEPNILKLDRANNWKNVEGSETSARYSNYNFFLFKDPIVKNVFDLIKLAYLEMLGALNEQRESMFIQCWINVHRKGQNLKRHAHKYPMHGHLTVNCDKTSTVYGDFGELIIPNEIGMLTLLGKPNVMHSVTPYKSNEGARVSIAFDLLPQLWIQNNVYWRNIYLDRIFIPFD